LDALHGERKNPLIELRQKSRSYSGGDARARMIQNPHDGIGETGHQGQGHERLHRARGQNSVLDMQHVKWAGQQQEIDEKTKDAHDKKEMQ